MADDRRRPGQRRQRNGVAGNEGGGIGRRQQDRGQDAGDQHGGGTLAAIQQQGRQCQLLVAGAEHIGGADIAGADLADIAEAGEAGEDQAEGNRAQQIAAGQDRELHPTESGRCLCRRHPHTPIVPCSLYAALYAAQRPTVTVQ